jgi:hypothetical protein
MYAAIRDVIVYAATSGEKKSNRQLVIDEGEKIKK